jgi:hypothetical protein
MSNTDALRKRARKNYARSLKAHAAAGKQAETAKQAQERAHMKEVRDSLARASASHRQGQQLVKHMERLLKQRQIQ